MRNTPLLLLAASLCSQAGAQTFTEVLRAGDALPGGTGELITRVDEVDINGSGDWLAKLDTDDDLLTDNVALHNGSIIWREGTTIGFNAPAGKEASSFLNVLDINDAGDIILVTGLRDVGTAATITYLFVWNGITVIQDDVTPCTAPSLPAGTLYNRVLEVWQNNNRQFLVLASLDIGGTNFDAMLRVDIDAAGNITRERVLALEGQTLPGANHVSPVQRFSNSKGRNAINDNGECIWFEEDDDAAPGSPLTDTNFYITNAAFANNLLYNEGDAFPTNPAQVFDGLGTAEVDLNNNGDFVYGGFDRGPSTENSWLFKSVGGVITVLAHEGDPTPASVPGNFLSSGSGFGGVVPISNSGDVLWFLDWNDPDISVDSGLLFNSDLILQEGVSMLGGLPVETLPDSNSELAMSDSGAFAIIEVVLDGGTIDRDAIFIVGLGGPLGTNYCTAAVNSTGAAGVMSIAGSPSVAADNVTVTASNLPPNQFGIFVTSRTQAFVPGAGGASNGNICLGGAIGRFFMQNQILSTGSTGSFSLRLPLTAFPQANGFVTVMPGDTWNFQGWHRDSVGLGSNFTDGLEASFQ